MSYYVYSGQVSSGIILSLDSMYIYSGGVANLTTVNYKGSMHVSRGGVANQTTVNSRGYLYVYNGGVANLTTVYQYGSMIISNGGGAYNTIVAGCILAYVSSGGSASKLTAGGHLYVGGTASKTTVAEGGAMTVNGGAVANSTTVGGDMTVNGTANSTVVYGGDMTVNGTANSTTVIDRGHLYVNGGGTANSTTVKLDGSMYVYSRGTANSTTVSSDGYLYVASGGVAKCTTVNSSGCLFVSGGGVASGITVNSSGYLHVYSGGTALNVIWMPFGGSVTIYKGATVTFASDCNGVFLGSDNQLLSSALTMSNMMLSGHSIYVMNSGVAKSTYVWHGIMYVSNGGTANDNIVNSGCLHVYNGGTANATSVWCGSMFVSGGGIANSITVNSGGDLYVSSGGVANSTAVDGGRMIVYGVANKTTVAEGGDLYVSRGGVANSTTVNHRGSMYVSRGASALAIKENGGYVSIAEGANVTFVANSFSALTLSNASATLHSGTTANSTTVNSGGHLIVYSGGVEKCTTVNRSGGMYVFSGGEVTGLLTIANGATFSACAGSIVDFDISSLAPDAAARVNNLSLIQGAPDYTVTVSATQAIGIYTLAEGVATFTKTITVMSDAGTTLGTVSVDGRLVYGRYVYLLNCISGVLSLAVADISDITPPTKPTAAADITSISNQNVTVTATFSDDSFWKQFSMDGTAWNTYTTGVVMTANGTIYFRGIDAVGNISEVASYDVTNIDKVAPTKPIAMADIAAPTNQTVTVTAVFSDDTAVKEYSLNNEMWQTYTSGVVMTANGTVYFRGIDAAGNISDVSSCEVANIDKIPPKPPIVAASTTAPIIGNVTVTATFSDDSEQKQYSFDNSTWQTYTVGVVFSENGTVYFRSIDAAGNASDVTGYTVANIIVGPVKIFDSASLPVSGSPVMTGKTLDHETNLMQVSSGGVANLTTVNDGGDLYVYDGGTANSTTVNDGGDLYVYDGGTANSTTVNGWGYLYVSSGGTANYTAVNNYGSMYVSSGGVANSTTVSGWYATLYVSSGGIANSTTVSGWFATMYVSSGGVANSTTVNRSGFMYVSSGGVANLTTVNSYGSMFVSSGGVANSTTVNRSGHLYVSSGGVANSTTVNRSGFMYVSSGGVANLTTVNSYGSMFVSSGGVANSTTVCHFGHLYVSSGGAANLTTVDPYGSMRVSSNGTANSTTVNRGYLYVFSGGVANFTIINGDQYYMDCYGNLYISSGGTANSATVNSYGNLYVSNGGAANSTTVNSCGIMYVSNGGVANSTTVNSGGYLYVSDGVARDILVSRGGSVFISGGTLAGMTTIRNGAYVFMDEGSVIDFDISAISPEAPALINNLSLIDWDTAPELTITVSTSQESGTYALANNTYNFFDSLTVVTDAGATLGMLALGGELVSGGYTYRLGLDYGVLSVTVEGGSPTVAASGDLNGDGRADVIMSITQVGHGAEGATGAWLIQSDQTAAWGDLSQRNAGWELFGTGVTTAGKSTNDVYVKSAENVVGAWTTDATGAVTGWETVGEFDASTQVLGLGDFNGDGQSDLLLRNTNGAVGCYFTNGRGWNYFQSLGDEWSICAVGDFNGDGRDDVVLKHYAGFAGSWLTQSDYTMAWADIDTLPEGFEIVGAGDFNGDGTDDVLLKNGNYYGAWLVNNGNAKSWMGLGDLGDVAVEQIADFDADGKDDLRVRTTAGDLGAQLVKGEDTLDWKYYGSVGQEWSTALAAI